uniref:Uncharacterized protein n=1 Tax=Arundo donax TaxID=35708 RepID=A0A0A9AVV1_ARUDO
MRQNPEPSAQDNPRFFGSYSYSTPSGSLIQNKLMDGKSN